MTSVGRGRGWTSVHEKGMPLRRPGEAASPVSPDMELDSLIAAVQGISLQESSESASTLRGVEELLKIQCQTEEGLRSVVKRLHDRSLEDRQFGMKAAAACASVACLEVGGTKLRYVLLQSVQKDFEDQAHLQTSSKTKFLNAISLLGEVFHRMRMPDGSPINALAMPILQYQDILLSGEEHEMELFTTQLAVNGRKLYDCKTAELEKLMLRVRSTLMSRNLSGQCRCWLLLALDLAANRYAPLSGSLQEFYQIKMSKQIPAPCMHCCLPSVTKAENILTADGQDRESRLFEELHKEFKNSNKDAVSTPENSEDEPVDNKICSVDEEKKSVSDDNSIPELVEICSVDEEKKSVSDDNSIPELVELPDLPDSEDDTGNESDEESARENSNALPSETEIKEALDVLKRLSTTSVVSEDFAKNLEAISSCVHRRLKKKQIHLGANAIIQLQRIQSSLTVDIANSRTESKKVSAESTEKKSVPEVSQGEGDGILKCKPVETPKEGTAMENGVIIRPSVKVVTRTSGSESGGGKKHGDDRNRKKSWGPKREENKKEDIWGSARGERTEVWGHDDRFQKDEDYYGKQTQRGEGATRPRSKDSHGGNWRERKGSEGKEQKSSEGKEQKTSKAITSPVIPVAEETWD